MCSFYNPNIQSKFEEDKRDFVNLKGLILGVYTIIFEINDCSELSDIDEIRSKGALYFMRYGNAYQERNLKLVDNSFPALLADMAFNSFQGGSNTFEEYILRQNELKMPEKEYEVLYTQDKIQDFVELLVYSNVAAKHLCTGERDFNKIFCLRKDTEEQMFYTLYERLKLYDFLKREMRLEIDNEKSEIKGKELSLCLKLRVK